MIGKLEGEGRENRAEVFEVTLAENFPNLMMDTIQIPKKLRRHSVKWIPDKPHLSVSYSSHKEIKDKEKIFKEAKGKNIALPREEK